MMYDKVTWPEKYDPKVSALYALNDIDVKASPAVVWKLLVETLNWSSYFPPEDNVRIVSGGAELKLGTVSAREVVGFPLTTTVTRPAPSRGLGLSGILCGRP